MIFKRFRIFVLLMILFGVSADALLKHHRLQDWSAPLTVGIFPINADSSEITKRYIATLSKANFVLIEQYISEQSKEHGLTLNRPLQVLLGPEIHEQAPKLPSQPGIFSSIYWSLAIRFWAKWNTPPVYTTPDIRIFALYFDSEKFKQLPDSAGLSKGQVGIAHLFADASMNDSNLVVVTHEMLHTLGATDKYNLQTNQPIFPVGYAEPYKTPLYPQETAEIMAGRLPVSETEAQIPESVQNTLVGQVTAREIGWIK